jgi:hypothetical protein
MQCALLPLLQSVPQHARTAGSALVLVPVTAQGQALQEHSAKLQVRPRRVLSFNEPMYCMIRWPSFLEQGVCVLSFVCKHIGGIFAGLEVHVKGKMTCHLLAFGTYVVCRRVLYPLSRPDDSRMVSSLCAFPPSHRLSLGWLAGSHCTHCLEFAK